MSGVKHRQFFDDLELGFILLWVGTITAFAEFLLLVFFNVRTSDYLPLYFRNQGIIQFDFIIFIIWVIK
jgi:hypothetical protein